MGLPSIFLCKALAAEAAGSICTGLPVPDIISSQALVLLQVAELLLESDDLEAVAGDVEKLLQQAKEADPANFEHLQVRSPLSVDLGCLLAVLGGPGPLCGMLKVCAGSAVEVRQTSLHCLPLL